MNVLNIAAHPDDELLGQGGTLALHARAGDRVTSLIVCEGSSIRYGDESTSEVEASARRANELLGVGDLRFLGLREQQLDRLSLMDIIPKIEPVIRDVCPKVVYTHCATDINRDHRILLEATLVALRPYSAPSVREVWAFETSSSTEWGGAPQWPHFQPHMFVDVTDTLEVKLKAFEQYVREVRSWPHPRSLEGLRVRARYWGSQVGCIAAEPFQAVRVLR